MSLNLIIVLAITLGFPILAIVALAATGAFHPELLSTFLVGGVVMIFVVGAIFEIRRMAGLDRYDDSEEHEKPAQDGSLEVTGHAAPLGARVYEAKPLPAASAREEAIAENPSAESEQSTDLHGGSAAAVKPIPSETIADRSDVPTSPQIQPEVRDGMLSEKRVLATAAPPAVRGQRKSGERSAVVQEAGSTGDVPIRPGPVAKGKRKGSPPKRPSRT